MGAVLWHNMICQINLMLMLAEAKNLPKFPGYMVIVYNFNSGATPLHGLVSRALTIAENITCIGNETHASQCGYTSPPATPRCYTESSAAGVRCAQGIIIYYSRKIRECKFIRISQISLRNIDLNIMHNVYTNSYLRVYH